MQTNKTFTKVILSLLLFMTGITGARAAGNVQYLALNIKGEMMFIALADNPVITYSGNMLHITIATEVTYDVEVADISRGLFTTTDRIPTGLNSLMTDSPVFRAGTLLFDHLKPGSTVLLLTTDGRVVEQATANADGQATVRLSEHPKGAYVVKTATQSFKIINR